MTINSNENVKIDRAVMRRLHQKSLIRWLVLTLVDWGIIVGMFVIAGFYNHLLVYWMVSLVIGNRIHALGIMGHDGAHYAISRNRFVNNMLTSFLVAWPLGFSLTGYRDFHFKHHQKVGTPEDPELIHKNWAKPEFELPLKKGKFIFWCLRDLTGYSFLELLRMMILTSPKNIIFMFPALTVLGIFWAVSLYLGAYWVLALWFFSYATSFWLTMRLRLWIEHVGSSSTHRVQLTWWQEILFCPHWISYHHEHHMFPTVPMWNLPALRREDQSIPVVDLGGHIQNLTKISFELCQSK